MRDIRKIMLLMFVSLVLATSVNAVNGTQTIFVNHTSSPGPSYYQGDGSIAVGLQTPGEEGAPNQYYVPSYSMYDEGGLYLYAEDNVTNELLISCVTYDYMSSTETEGIIARCDMDTNNCDIGLGDEPAMSNCYGSDVFYYVDTYTGTIEAVWENDNISYDDYDPKIVSTTYNVTSYIQLDGMFYESYDHENGSSNHSHSYRVLIYNYTEPYENETYWWYENSTLLNNSNMSAGNGGWLAAGLELPPYGYNNTYNIPIFQYYDGQYEQYLELELFASNDHDGVEIALVCKPQIREEGVIIDEAYGIIAECDPFEQQCYAGYADAPAESHCQGIPVYYYLNSETESLEVIWEIPPSWPEYDDYDPTIISYIHQYDQPIVLDGIFTEFYDMETGSSGYNKSYRLIVSGSMCQMYQTYSECVENNCIWDEGFEVCLPTDEPETKKLRNSTNSTGNITFDRTKMVASGLEMPTSNEHNMYELKIDNNNSLLLAAGKNGSKEQIGIICKEGPEYWTLAYHDDIGQHGKIDEPGQTHCAGRQVYYYIDTALNRIEAVWEVDPETLQYDDQDPAVMSTIHKTDKSVMLDGHYDENYEKETASSGNGNSYRLKLQLKVLPTIVIETPVPLYVTHQDKVRLEGHVEDKMQQLTESDIDAIKIYLDEELIATVYDSTEFNANLTGLPYGEHMIGVVAITHDGMKDTRSRAFTIDDRAPEIRTVYPENNAIVHQAMGAEFRVKDIAPVQCMISDGEGVKTYNKKRMYFGFGWEGPYMLDVYCAQGNLTSTSQLNVTVNNSLQVLKTNLQDYIDAHQSELNIVLQEYKNNPDYAKDIIQAMQFEQRINNIIAELDEKRAKLAALNANNGTETNYTQLLNEIREIFGMTPLQAKIMAQHQFGMQIDPEKKEKLLNITGGKEKNANVQAIMTSSLMEYANGTQVNTTVFTFTARIGGKNYEVTVESSRVDISGFNESMINILVIENGGKYEIVLELNKNITGTNDLDLCPGANQSCSFNDMDQSVFKIYVDNGVEFTVVDADPIVKWSFDVPKQRRTAGGGGGGSATPVQQNTTAAQQAVPAQTFNMPEVKEGAEPEKKEETATETKAETQADEQEAKSNKVTGGFFTDIPPVAKFGGIAILLALVVGAYFVYGKFKN